MNSKNILFSQFDRFELLRHMNIYADGEETTNKNKNNDTQRNGKKWTAELFLHFIIGFARRI